jgi:hypothetical protein
MSAVPMARLDAVGATLNFRNPTRGPFILNGPGMNLNFRYVRFHGRNFLVLPELAGGRHP